MIRKIAVERAIVLSCSAFLLFAFIACQPSSREMPSSPDTEAAPGMSSQRFEGADAPDAPETPQVSSETVSTPSTFEKTYIDTHNGYSEAVVIRTGDLKTIHISGQIGEGETLDAQMRSALGKLTALLEGQGATMKDVVKMNTYIVDYGPESLDVFRGVRKELMGDTDMPASTLVGVEALALPEWLIEIEAIAVVPLR